MNSFEIDLFEKKLGFRKLKHSPAMGASRGLAIIWDSIFTSFSPLEIKQNWIGGTVGSYNNKLRFNLINVYSPIQNRDKARVWLELEAFLDNHPNKVCIIGGDFNVITKVEDKRGGSFKPPPAAIDFNNWINRNSLLEIQTTKNAFTWNNRRIGFCNIAEKLDRFFIHGGLSELNYTIEAKPLPLSGFDHFPLQLNILTDHSPRNCPFKFESMWFRDDNIINLIEHWWNGSVFSGLKMFIVANKLKLIKRKLLEWNRENFGNIFDKKLLIEKDLKDVNSEVLEKGMDEHLFLKEKSLLFEYEKILSKEEIYWRQKSKETWLKDGDRNTKFFHNSTKQRRWVNRISNINNCQGTIMSESVDVASEAVRFFDNILNNTDGSNLRGQLNIINNLPKLINDDHNKCLLKKFSEEEVKSTLMKMNLDKAPSPDGFPTSFFQKCWGFMGPEITEALEGVRNSRKILKEINNTLLALIPKKEKLDSFNDFRPIALCNTLYKLLTKTLAARLQKLLPFIISEEQTGFVADRSIYDGVIIAQEAIHSVQLNNAPSMLVKLDISKAYDKVDWRFLCKCLEAFGFSKTWINLIFECISTPKFSILVNGTPEGFFSSSRGLRQGDPMSPFLFIIMAEALGRSISKAKEEGGIQCIPITSGLPSITHQQFVDDTMLFGQGNIREVRALKGILNSYMIASGQEVNLEKSTVFMFNIDPTSREEICRVLEIKQGLLPCKYLGIPLDKGRRSSKLWDNLVEKIKSRINTWKGRWLSFAGRATLVKSVLTAMPIYLLSCQNLSSNK
ncbi:hypothetical protein SUGI_0848590 [Cryptomeria japonica]|nr:hypothetical protein SUGI_0848590 [Cryptomeria japonica]